MAKLNFGWFAKHKILTAIGIVIILIAASSSGGSTNKNKASTASTTTSKTSTNTQTAKQQTPVASQAKAAFDDGTQIVGKDVQPGTYRTKGSDGSNFGCYWARLSGFGGSVDEIIANNGSYDKGPQVVTIAATDKGFQTRGCGKWYSQLDQVTTSKTAFGGGTFIVGTDVQPGTYKNSGASSDYSCYFARLSGFSGELSDIIANDNTKNAVVTIDGADKGFSSTGCGTWTLAQ
jgi:hypothetical protein